MTEALPDGDGGRVDATAADRVLEIAADVIAVGPGLGVGPGPREFVRALLERSGVPLVLDADALNAFAGDAESLQGRDGLDVIVTPHPGELARLLGLSIEEIQRDRIAAARSFATSHHLHVILKGHRSVVAGPDGRVGINLTGNPGMATGGSGDVLTGMVAAWFAQLLDAEAACRLAVFLHGAAGDIAEQREGQVSMIATDLLDCIGEALTTLVRGKTEQS
jgi:NAD(P)H-hydrate epimerase